MPNSPENIIDVLIAIDADTIVEQLTPGPTPDHPTQITQQDLIYMVSKSSNVVSGQAGSELTIKARTLDVIRWRETSLSLNAAYDSILYAFEATAGKELISPPTPLLVDVTTPLPNPADPTKPTTQTIKNYFWNCNVLSQGKVTYHFSFMVVDRDANVVGYYWWDPFIQVSD